MFRRPDPNRSCPGGASSAAGSADLRTAIRQVSDQVRPAIVQITNLQQQPGQLATGVAVPSGVGSGVIDDAQAHILRWLVGPR
jgi:hypothetical protein